MKKIIVLVMAAVISTGALVGCGTSKNTSENKPAVTATETEKPDGPIKAKVLVNISGEITEISEDGKKLKVNDQWIIITDETVFEDDPDNGVEAVSKDFKVGNRISGYTADDTTLKEVKAGQIYSNWSPESSSSIGGPMGKIAVNISGRITEISEDGSKIKINDQWVIITENTDFSDDPDNGSKPVSKDFKVGNYVQGYTTDDTSNAEVTATAISANNPQE